MCRRATTLWAGDGTVKSQRSECLARVHCGSIQQNDGDSDCRFHLTLTHACDVCVGRGFPLLLTNSSIKGLVELRGELTMMRC